MSDRIYLDSYAMVGRRGPKDVETPYATEALLEEMAWAGVHGLASLAVDGQLAQVGGRSLETLAHAVTAGIFLGLSAR